MPRSGSQLSQPSTSQPQQITSTFLLLFFIFGTGKEVNMKFHLQSNQTTAHYFKQYKTVCHINRARLYRIPLQNIEIKKADQHNQRCQIKHINIEN